MAVLSNDSKTPTLFYMSGSLRGPLLLLLLAASSCTLGAGGSARLPPPGTPVFGPQGLFGTVGGQADGTAIVNPVGGGAPAVMVPNGNGTATVIRPGSTPEVITNPAR